MFLANLFAARLLSQEIFGQYSIIKSTVGAIDNVVSGSFGTFTIKSISKVDVEGVKNIPILIGSTILVNIVVVVVFLLLSVFFAPKMVELYLLGATPLVSALHISILLLASTLFFALMQQVMIGLEDYRNVAKLSLISSLSSIPIIWTLISILGLNGALIGIFVYQVIDITLKYKSLKSRNLLLITFKPFKRLISSFKKITSVCTPLIFATLISAVSLWYSKIYLISYSDNFVDLAIFDVAQQWLIIIMIITGSTTNIVIPMLSITIDSKKENKKVFYVNIAINFLISLGIASVFILLSQEIMSIYGESYKVGSTTLEILSVTSIFYTMSSIFNKYMISHNKMWSVVINSIFSSIALAIGLIMYIDLKSEGLAYALLSYYVVSIVIYVIHYFVLRITE